MTSSLMKFLAFAWISIVASAAPNAPVTLTVLRENIAPVAAKPELSWQFEIGSVTRKIDARVDLGDFVKSDGTWSDGSEGITRLDITFHAEDAMLRLWLHYRVCIFVGDGTHEQPIEVSGTVPVGRKGLRIENEALKKKLAEVIRPAFEKAGAYIEGKNPAKKP